MSNNMEDTKIGAKSEGRWRHAVQDNGFFHPPIKGRPETRGGMLVYYEETPALLDQYEDDLAAARAALVQVYESCINGPLSTDARGLATWWEGFDSFVAETVMPLIGDHRALIAHSEESSDD